jgi:integrase
MKIPPNSSSTFAAFSLTIVSSLPLRKKTKATYNSVLIKHVHPAIGNHKLDEVSRVEIQKIILELPPQTSAMTLAAIKTVYREARARSLVESSPAHGISNPRIIVSPRKFLTWDDIRKADLGKYQKQIHFLALHGLRWSEAMALRDDDIRDGRIYISRSIHGQTKSKASIRTVPLVSEFALLPKSPKTLNHALKKYSVTTHSLRHTYAYLLKQQGVHVTTAQRLLGHADPRVTMSIYTQVLDNEIDEAGALLRNTVNAYK